MGLQFFTSLLLSWVCLSFSIGIMLVLGSLGRGARHDFESRN